jgi:putative tryptophan/tyrosine transport system substrate-binding protein
MRLIGLAVVLALGLVLAPLAAEAQQAEKTPRIGILVGGSASSDSGRIEAFRQGLRELGYVEGKTIVLELRFADGNPERLNGLAATLVRRKVDVIVAAGPNATRSAKEATTTIPIVMAQVNDPVGARFAASLARPGGTITGLATMTPEIIGKQLELLRQVVPRLARVAVLENPTQPGREEMLREMERAAASLRVQLQYLDVVSRTDIETSLRTARKQRADAVLVLSSPVLFSQRKQIANLAIQNRLPTISPWPEFVDDGGLITYSANFKDLFRRAATFVDKILKGAKPGDLPVEQPTTFELLINLKTAKALGLTIPQSILVRADQVIE